MKCLVREFAVRLEAHRSWLIAGYKLQDTGTLHNLKLGTCNLQLEPCNLGPKTCSPDRYRISTGLLKDCARVYIMFQDSRQGLPGVPESVIGVELGALPVSI